MRGEKILIAKILALIFPILLFIFKYILPSIAETVFTNKSKEKEQIKIELLHFSVDLLFVAIGYNVPKIIEITSNLYALTVVSDKNIKIYQELMMNAIKYSATTFFILFIIPFYVLGSKLAEKWYFEDKKTQMLFVEIILYMSAFFLIWISLFL